MAGAETKEFKIFGMGMLAQVLLGLVLGIAVGYFAGKQAEELKILGTIFFKLIKMVIAPLILFALISGITSLTQGQQFKGMALKGTSAYLITALLAVVLGLTVGAIFEPGHGVPKPDSSVASKTEEVLNKASKGAGSDSAGSVKDFLMHLIPGNIVTAMANDMYLQIVVFAIFTGIVINNLKGDTTRILEINKEMAAITFKMIEWIVRLAPFAVFGYMASMVGTTGFDVIKSLLRLVLLVIAACLIQYLFFGVLIFIFAKLSPLPFYNKMVNTQIMAFSTSSSKATLTTAMRELREKLGVSQTTTNFMMPLGACINMDGTAIYLGICAMFFAQIYGIHLDLHNYLMLIMTCTLGSIGAAGIPSGSIIFMSMVLASVGIPIEGISIILAVDRILDMFRTTVNITGDAAITLIIDKIEGDLDQELYNS